jgi:hypothetical protein
MPFTPDRSKDFILQVRDAAEAAVSLLEDSPAISVARFAPLGTLFANNLSSAAEQVIALPAGTRMLVLRSPSSNFNWEFTTKTKAQMQASLKTELAGTIQLPMSIEAETNITVLVASGTSVSFHAEVYGIPQT